MFSKDALTVVSEIKKLNPKLNTWENDFVSNIEKLANKGYSFSKSQLMTLMGIYGKATGGGIYQKRQYI